MKDFISLGWMHYATVGRSYAGGWATPELLFAVDESYDRNSENFKNSYLRHEGQHFADYIQFPKLKQTDLEYRAKLVELAKSQQTTYKLIEKFLHNSRSRKGNAHAFANYCVIRDLSGLIFNKNFEENKEQWSLVSSKIIKEKSIELFKKHTQQLIKRGSEDVEELIK